MSEVLWLKVEVVAVDKDTAAQSTLVFSNRMLTSVDSYAILKPEMSVDITMGEFLPNDSAGSLILNSGEQTFGMQRRFVDILERYTLIDQLLNLQSGYSTLLVEPAVWRTDLKARVQDISYDVESGDLTINYYTRAFRNERLGIPVSAGAQFSDPLVESIGQTIPMVLGYSPILPADGISTSLQDVQGIRVEKNRNKWLFGAFKDSDIAGQEYPFNFADTSPDGAAWGNLFPNSRFQVLMPNSAGVYIPVDAGFPDSGTNLPLSGTVSGAGVSLFEKEVASPVKFDSFIGAIIPKKVSVSMIGNNDVGYSAGTSATSLKIYEVDANYSVISQIAAVTFQHADYESDIQGSGPFQMEGVFNEWPVLDPSNLYIWALSQNGDVTEGVLYQSATAATAVSLVRDLAQSSAPFSINAGDTGLSVLSIQPEITLTNLDLAALSSGKWGAAQMEIGAGMITDGNRNQYGIAPTPIIRVIGPKTSVSGSLDGTVGEFIHGPYQMLRYLDLKYLEGGGGTWVPDQFDSSPISTTGSGKQSTWPGPYRSLIAVSPDGASIREMAEDICRQGACRVAMRPDAAGDGLLSFEQWGEDRDPVAVPFSDELGVVIESIQVRGKDSISNFPTLFIGQRLSGSGVSRAAVNQGVFDAADIIKGDGILSYELTQLRNKSLNAYGFALLRDERFQFLADRESAQAMISYYLRELSQPSVYITLTAPHRTYGFVHCLDLIDLTHPALPAFFGTSVDSELPTFDDEPVDPIYGHPLKRAKVYRCQVEGRRMVVSPEQSPYIEFIVRVKQ